MLEKEGMDLDLEWKKKVVEKLYLEEEKRVEKKYLLKLGSRMIKYKSLNTSQEFIRILKKKKLNTKYFTVYFDKNSNNLEKKRKFLNISFVMKKKIGNAVIRNKIKRKLKAAVQKVFLEKHNINLNYTYIVFGKNNVYKDKFSLIYNEIDKTFEKVNQAVN